MLAETYSRDRIRGSLFSRGEAKQYKQLIESWSPGGLNLGRWASLVTIMRELKLRQGALLQSPGCLNKETTFMVADVGAARHGVGTT